MFFSTATVGEALFGGGSGIKLSFEGVDLRTDGGAVVASEGLDVSMTDTSVWGAHEVVRGDANQLTAENLTYSSDAWGFVPPRNTDSEGTRVEPAPEVPQEGDDSAVI